MPMPVPVLVVDYDATKRFALRSVVAPLGCAVVEAGSGQAAVDCVCAQDFAVILLDVLMPIMDGLQTAAMIRTHERAWLTPIIFTTALSPEEISRADLFAQGAVDFIHGPISAHELRAKVSAFAGIFANTAELLAKARYAEACTTRLERLNVELAAIARRDALTGLPNRRALSEDLEGIEARVSRYGHRYCMAVADVDNFKAYNDAYGHQAGDEALQIVSSRLTELLRTGDLLYRYGGEEFLCIFAEQSLDSGVTALERMRRGVEALGICHPGNAAGVLTLSGGVAILEPPTHCSASQVLKAADEALYRAKALGRNRIEFTEGTAPEGAQVAALVGDPHRLNGNRAGLDCCT